MESFYDHFGFFRFLNKHAAAHQFYPKAQTDATYVTGRRCKTNKKAKDFRSRTEDRNWVSNSGIYLFIDFYVYRQGKELYI